MSELQVLVHGHVQGLAVNLEWEAHDAWMDQGAPTLRELAQSGRFPTFTKVLRSFEGAYDLRLDTVFESGLAALLDGLTPVVERKATA